jgi:hypothetical protein
MTYSFGSISFGSLVVSVIQFIKQLVSVGRSAAQQEGDTIFQIIFCCLECLAGFIEGLVQYFNHYAYTQIALYGKVYSLSPILLNPRNILTLQEKPGDLLKIEVSMQL